MTDTTGQAIGLIIGKKDENRFRIELYSESSPAFKEKFTYSYTTSDNATSTTVDGATMSNDKNTSSSLTIEGIINEKIFSLNAS